MKHIKSFLLVSTKVLQFILIISVFCIELSQASAPLEKLFEGYYKIEIMNRHAGYVIDRYEVDNKNKQIIETRFLKATGDNTNITESYKTISSLDFTPISYSYTSIIGTVTTTIDGKIKKGVLTATKKVQDLSQQNNIKGNKKPSEKIERIERKLPEGTFFSGMLMYMIMRSKTGLQTNNSYPFKAIAEELADIADGEAVVGKLETLNNNKVFKVQITFNKDSYFNYVNEQGETLSTNSPTQGNKTELVGKPSEATAGFPVSSSILTSLFNEVPLGVYNSVARAIRKDLPKNQPGATKQYGIAPGQGIQIKPGSKVESKPNPAPEADKE